LPGDFKSFFGATKEYDLFDHRPHGGDRSTGRIIRLAATDRDTEITGLQERRTVIRITDQLL